MKDKSNCRKDSCRLAKVGGQAVLEGVMMKAGSRTVTSCRKEDGSIVVTDGEFVSVRKKHKFLNIPILRGVVNFIESLVLSVKTLNISAEAMGLEEEEGKAEKWMKKHLGIGVTDIIMVIATVLGLALSLFLFMFLPTWIADGLNRLSVNSFGWGEINENIIAVIEGVLKVAIFIIYLLLVSLMPDIRRTFQYHGAEHKSIACFEAGDELTPENAMKHKRFHPRCGTSFMFLMILIGIFMGMFVRNILPPDQPSIVYTAVKLLLLPLTMGIGYEILMLAGKHDNLLTRIISAPGLWVQRITTKEPDESQLEIAITSIKCALRDEFPEFAEFWENRGWETEEEKAKAETLTAAEAAEPSVAEEENGTSTDEPRSAEDVTAQDGDSAQSTDEPSADAI